MITGIGYQFALQLFFRLFRPLIWSPYAQCFQVQNFLLIQILVLLFQTSIRNYHNYSKMLRWKQGFFCWLEHFEYSSKESLNSSSQYYSDSSNSILSAFLGIASSCSSGYSDDYWHCQDPTSQHSFFEGLLTIQARHHNPHHLHFLKGWFFGLW